MARRTKTPRRQSAAGFSAKDVIELRQAIGRLTGKKLASRELIARLVQSSPGSVYNWEQGTAPNRHYIEKLIELRRRAHAGELSLSQPGGQGATRAAMPSARSNGAAPATTATLPSSGKPEFANVVQVLGSGDTTWLRFGLQRPGAREAETLIELVVPSNLLESLRR